MVSVSPLMVVVALALIGVAFWGMTRVPTAFIPNEDQGYLMVNVQLPDGASLERTSRALTQVSEIAKSTPGVENVIAISGISVLDNSASLPSSGLAYVVLADWSVREKAKDQDILSLFRILNEKFGAQLLEAAITIIPPPPIQGIGNAGGFNMIIQVKDGSVDFNKLQNVTNQIVSDAASQIYGAYGVHAVPSDLAADLPRCRPQQGGEARCHCWTGFQRAWRTTSARVT